MRLRSLASAAALAFANAAQGQRVDLNVVSKVEIKDVGSSVVVSIRGSKPPNFTTFSMMDPPRFVIDLSESTFRNVPEDVPVGDGLIKVIKNLSYGSEANSIARVMIAFEREVDPPDVQTAGETLIVNIAKPPGMPVAQAAPADEAARRREAQAAAEAKARAEQEARAKAEEEAKSKAAALAAAQAEAAAKARAEQETRARAEAEARAKAEEEARAKAPALAGAPAAPGPAAGAGTVAAADTAAAAQAEAAAMARAKEEAAQEARAREAEEARAKAEAQAQADAAARAAAETEAAEKAQAEARAKAGQEAQARAQAEAARAQQEARAQEEARARAEAEAASRAQPEAKPETAAPPVVAALPPVAPKPERISPERLSRGPSQVREVGFKMLPDASRVFVRMSGLPEFTIQEAGENVIRLELANTRVKRRNDTRFLDTSFFPSAVAMVTPKRQGSSYVLEIKLKQRVPYQQKVEGDMLAIDFERPASMRSAAAPAPAPAPQSPPAQPSPAEATPEPAQGEAQDQDAAPPSSGSTRN